MQDEKYYVSVDFGSTSKSLINTIATDMSARDYNGKISQNCESNPCVNPRIYEFNSIQQANDFADYQREHGWSVKGWGEVNGQKWYYSAEDFSFDTEKEAIREIEDSAAEFLKGAGEMFDRAGTKLGEAFSDLFKLQPKKTIKGTPLKVRKDETDENAELDVRAFIIRFRKALVEQSQDQTWTKKYRTGIQHSIRLLDDLVMRQDRGLSNSKLIGTGYPPHTDWISNSCTSDNSESA